MVSSIYGTPQPYGSIQTYSSQDNSTDKPTQQEKAETAAGTSAGDKVSLSPQARQGQLREMLGLNPSKPARREDIKAIVQQDKGDTLSALEKTLTANGIDKNEKFSLSMDIEGDILVEGDFEGKGKLETALNADKEFKQRFARLSINSEILDYSKGVQSETKRMDIASYFNGDAGTGDDLLADITRQYQDLTALSRKDPLSALIDLSSAEGNRFSLPHPEE